ncbi:MAG: LysR substrate-binding domain-containing protein [Enterobacteriaceae bacterium]|nr:LysR substrate-binding domain-containing protein [Enterobacteriaceae bacterium]
MGLYLLAPVIIQFRQRYPDAIFDLRLNNQILSPAEDSLDLAVRIGDLPDSALLSRRLAPYQLCCYASPDYLIRKGMPHQRDDLINHEHHLKSGFLYNFWII